MIFQLEFSDSKRKLRMEIHVFDLIDYSEPVGGHKGDVKGLNMTNIVNISQDPTNIPLLNETYL